VTGLGNTLGFTALSPTAVFKLPSGWNTSWFCGTLACQGGPFEWIGMHRIHHLHSDQTADPMIPIRASGGATWLDDSTAPAGSKFLHQRHCGRQYISFTKFFVQVALGCCSSCWVGWFVVWEFCPPSGGVPLHWLVNSATISLAIAPMNLDNSTNCWWVALLCIR